MRLTGKTAIALLAALAALCATAVAGSARPTSKNGPKAAIRVKTVAVGAGGRFRVGLTLIAPKLGRHVRRYQWLRCNHIAGGCHRIKGATHRQYTIRRNDVGHKLRVVEELQGNTAAVSSPTGTVSRPMPVNTALPTITDGGQGGGTLSGPQVGDVLTGTNGTWTNAVRFTYAWEDCTTASPPVCTPISGATSQTYTVQSSDVGSTIELVVTGYNF
jgi:hypothetical protein